MELPRFDVIEIPGSGAHAAVCVAFDRVSGDRVCLKVLRSDFGVSSSEAKRARDEARLLQRLDHPGIVGMRERIEIDGREVLVMEWVDGPPLSRVVRRLGRLPVGVALRIAREVAEAVDYAYHLTRANGRPLRLVHRDLNLNNVLIGVDGRVRILDYGMARAEFDEREAETLVALLGTAGFTAPEGLVRIADNPKLDVYSLGICLFFMLTGHLPVLSRQRLAHASGLGEQLAFARARVQTDGVDPDPIDALIRSMCAWAPDDRPTMGEVVDRLRALEPPDVDLAAFAAREVAPIHDGRSRTPPQTHDAWPELAFLTRVPGPAAPTPPLDTGPALRALLRQPDWPGRPDEVRALATHADTGPLLDALRAYLAPWWKVFARRPPADGALVLLELIAARPTPAARALCARLARHPDPRIAARAGEIARSSTPGADGGAPGV